MKPYLIASCGTNIGKTFITTILCKHLVEQKKTVNAIKPLISGWRDDDNDTKHILASLDRSYTPETIKSTSPWRMNHPLAPNAAAKLAGISLQYNDILDFCRNKMQDSYDFLLIESAGGVMSPITDYHTWVNLIKDLQISVILVVGVYLGSISHALTALTAIKDFDIKAIVVNQKDKVDVDETVQFIKRYSQREVILVPHQPPTREITSQFIRDVATEILGE